MRRRLFENFYYCRFKRKRWFYSIVEGSLKISTIVDETKRLIFFHVEGSLKISTIVDLSERFLMFCVEGSLKISTIVDFSVGLDKSKSKAL